MEPLELEIIENNYNSTFQALKLWEGHLKPKKVSWSDHHRARKYIKKFQRKPNSRLLMLAMKYGHKSRNVWTEISCEVNVSIQPAVREITFKLGVSNVPN